MTKASVYVEWLEAESHRTAKELSPVIGSR